MSGKVKLSVPLAALIGALLSGSLIGNAVAQFEGLVDPRDAFQWASNYDDVFILDVRTGEEWRWVGHPGPNGLADSKGKGLAYRSGALLGGKAINIAYMIQVNDGTPALTLNPLFVEDVMATFDSDAVLLVMCRSGGRAQSAAEELGALGFTTYNVEGGFEGHNNTDAYPGPDTGYHDVDGWVNAKLPYNYNSDGGYYVNYMP